MLSPALGIRDIKGLRCDPCLLRVYSPKCNGKNKNAAVSPRGAAAEALQRAAGPETTPLQVPGSRQRVLRPWRVIKGAGSQAGG